MTEYSELDEMILRRTMLELMVKSLGYSHEPPVELPLHYRAWRLAVHGLTSHEVDLAVQSIHEVMAREEGMERRK